MPRILRIRNMLNMPDGFQATVELATKGMAVLVSITERQKVADATIAVDELQCLRLEFDGIEP